MPSSKISFRSESPKSENERRCDHAGDAVHHDFERNGDLLLDLLRRDSRPLRDDLDVVVRHVRIGFHRKLMERDRAPDKQQDRDRQDQKAILQREIDQLCESFYCSTVFCKHQRVRYHLLARLDARDDFLQIPGKHVARRPLPRAGNRPSWTGI